MHPHAAVRFPKKLHSFAKVELRMIVNGSEVKQTRSRYHVFKVTQWFSNSCIQKLQSPLAQQQSHAAFAKVSLKDTGCTGDMAISQSLASILPSLPISQGRFGSVDQGLHCIHLQVSRHETKPGWFPKSTTYLPDLTLASGGTDIS